MSLLVNYEALGREVPISSNSLRSKLDDVLFGHFAQAKVSNFDFSFMEKYVLGFQIVMNDLFWQLMQVFNSIYHLFNNHFSLLLG